MPPRSSLRRHELLVNDRLVAHAKIAKTFSARLVGLLGTGPEAAPLVLTRTTSVHGVGMTRTLDVAVLADDGRVLAVHRLRPFGLTLPTKGGRTVLEASDGSFASWPLRVGDVVTWRQAQ